MAGINVSTKQCSVCKVIKLASDFYKCSKAKDGLQHECKACNKKRAATPAGKARNLKSALKYIHTEAGKAKARSWAKTEKGQHNSKKAKQRYARSDRTRAYGILWYEIQTGKRPRATAFKCHLCANQASHYHHHKGYSKEYAKDVIPLCAMCHKKIHMPVRKRHAIFSQVAEVTVPTFVYKNVPSVLDL